MGPQKWAGLGRGENGDFYGDENDSFDENDNQYHTSSRGGESYGFNNQM